MQMTIESYDRAAQRAFWQGPLDLSDLKYFDPAGAVMMACAVESRRVRGENIEVKPPKSERAREFLEWFGVASELAASSDRDASGSRKHYRTQVVTDSNGIEHVLLNQRTFKLTRMAISQDAHDFSGRDGRAHLNEVWLSTVLSRHLEVIEHEQARLLHLAAVELAVNVVDHARADASFVAANVRPRVNERGSWLQFVVGDVGIGVQSSLAERHGPMTSLDAVALAVQLGVSGAGAPGRGRGLSMLAKAVAKVRGQFSLISGDGRVDIDGEGVRPSRCAEFPGTLVVIGVGLP